MSTDSLVDTSSKPPVINKLVGRLGLVEWLDEADYGLFVWISLFAVDTPRVLHDAIPAPMKTSVSESINRIVKRIEESSWSGLLVKERSRRAVDKVPMPAPSISPRTCVATPDRILLISFPFLRLRLSYSAFKRISFPPFLSVWNSFIERKL